MNMNQEAMSELDKALDEETGITKAEEEETRKEIEEKNKKFGQATMQEIIDAFELVQWYLDQHARVQKVIGKAGKGQGSPLDGLLGGMVKNMVPRVR